VLKRVDDVSSFRPISMDSCLHVLYILIYAVVQYIFLIDSAIFILSI
jgi:hypothetical protein